MNCNSTEAAANARRFVDDLQQRRKYLRPVGRLGYMAAHKMFIYKLYIIKLNIIHNICMCILYILFTVLCK